MDEPQKPRRRGNNPKGSPQNLVPGGGRKPALALIPHSKVLPAKWEEFCLYYVALNKNTGEAAANAGFSSRWGRALLHFPEVQKRIEEIAAKKSLKLYAKIFGKVELNKAELGRDLMKIAGSEPHEMRNYADAVKAIEVGYRALGVIEETRGVKVGINNQNQTQVGSNSFEVYEAEWVTKNKERMDQILEAKYTAQDGAAQHEIPPEDNEAE